MKWGTFSLSQIPDLSRVPENFETDFEQFALAEELGFDTIWIAEHLFSSYGVVTSTQVLAAAIAKATKKIKIGMAVVVAADDANAVSTQLTESGETVSRIGEIVAAPDGPAEASIVNAGHAWGW